MRGVFQAVQQVAVRRLDRDAAEHGDRAGRRDRQRARAPCAQLHHGDVGHGADDPRRQRAHERERRHQRQRQQQQQRGDEQHHPEDRQVRRRQQDRRGARQAGHAAERELDEAHSATTPIPGGKIARRRHRGGPAREDFAQRAEHRHDRREHPPADGDQDALRADDPLRADGERRGQVARIGVEQMDRELVAEHQTEHARQHAQHDRVEQQHHDHARGRIPVAAQIRDQPPALGHRQEHRVEREQEPDER